MAGKVGTRVVSGSVEVVTAQTAVQLTTTALEGPCLGVYVSADPGNAGKAVAVGGSKVTTNAKPKELKGLHIREFNGPVLIEVDDPSKLWVDVETSKDKVTWLAVLA